MLSLEITVVIPTHNRVDFLREAFQSVVDQSVEAEIIIVDDGSTDPTPDWLVSLDEPRVLWFRQEPGRGGSAARNRGLDACRSPFVMFLDDDDLLRPDALSTLWDALQAAPEAAGAAGSYRRFGDVDRAERDLHPSTAVTAPLWRELLFGWNMPPAALLWRSDVVRAIGGWDASLPRCEDRNINLRAYPRVFTLVPDTVMSYRVHAAQVPSAATRIVHREMVQRFVSTLPPPDRSVGKAIIDLQERFPDALDAYNDGRYREALPTLWEAAVGSTALRRSPVLGRWLMRLVATAVIGALGPRRPMRLLHHWLRGRNRIHQ
ncbi:MAG: glycosyltransferase [Actinomycetota bacterium]|nr:glycosyltransferase [Actinomycetota bacterium]